MNTSIRRITISLTAGLLLSVACKRRISGAELKEQLEKAMTQHLDSGARSSTLHPHFDVLDVAWYEETDYYRCEFKVKMTLPDGKDTTGIMKQKVSKDFSRFE